MVWGEGLMASLGPGDAEAGVGKTRNGVEAGRDQTP